jgi:hypothetical protein
MFSVAKCVWCLFQVTGKCPEVMDLSGTCNDNKKHSNKGVSESLRKEEAVNGGPLVRKEVALKQEPSICAIDLR